MKKLIRAALILLLIGVLCYAGLIGMVVWKEKHVPQAESYDAIVVLGAQVKADGSLSVQLEWRLESALSAYNTHPATIVCCGGQGANEPAPEGEVMRDWLIAHGVPEERVKADTVSVNTRQNLREAAALLPEGGVICVVTSDYHLPRALALAEDEGLTAVGVGAPTKPEYWLKNHAREALAWVKYWAQKYLGLSL